MGAERTGLGHAGVGREVPGSSVHLEEPREMREGCTRDSSSWREGVKIPRSNLHCPQLVAPKNRSPCDNW